MSILCLMVANEHLSPRGLRGPPGRILCNLFSTWQRVLFIPFLYYNETLQDASVCCHKLVLAINLKSPQMLKDALYFFMSDCCVFNFRDFSSPLTSNFPAAYNSSVFSDIRALKSLQIDLGKDPSSKAQSYLIEIFLIEQTDVVEKVSPRRTWCWTS